MKTWDDWSDKDINARVTSIVFDLDGWQLTEKGCSFYHCGIDGDGYYSQPVIDYCNSWSGMGPLIVENNIGLNQPMPWEASLEWDANIFSDDGSVEYNAINTNPLRAAAIVFLEMNGVKP